MTANTETAFGGTFENDLVGRISRLNVNYFTFLLRVTATPNNSTQGQRTKSSSKMLLLCVSSMTSKPDLISISLTPQEERDYRKFLGCKRWYMSSNHLVIQPVQNVRFQLEQCSNFILVEYFFEKSGEPSCRLSKILFFPHKFVLIFLLLRAVCRTLIYKVGGELSSGFQASRLECFQINMWSKSSSSS